MVYIDSEVRNFVKSLDKNKVGKIVNFGSAAILNSTYKKSKPKQTKSAFPWTNGNSTAKTNSKGFTRENLMRMI